MQIVGRGCVFEKGRFKLTVKAKYDIITGDCLQSVKQIARVESDAAVTGHFSYSRSGVFAKL